MAQSAKRPAAAQVMVSPSMSSSPTSGSVLPAQSLEPTWDSVSPLSLFPSPARALSRSVSQKYILKKNFFLRKKEGSISQTHLTVNFIRKSLFYSQMPLNNSR